MNDIWESEIQKGREEENEAEVYRLIRYLYLSGGYRNNLTLCRSDKGKDWVLTAAGIGLILFIFLAVRDGKMKQKVQ